MTATEMRRLQARPAPARAPKPGRDVPHTIRECDRALARLLVEMGGRARHAAFNVWLDERLRAARA